MEGIEQLRDDGRTFEQLRAPQIELVDKTVLYRCTDTVVIVTIHSSAYFYIFVSASQSCNSLSVAASRAFVSLAVQSSEKITVRLHITTCDKAIPAHLVNATTAALAIFGVPTNGVFAVGCSHDATKFDGPESCVFLATGSGRRFVFAERINDIAVVNSLSLKCDEMRELMRAALCE